MGRDLDAGEGAGDRAQAADGEVLGADVLAVPAVVGSVDQLARRGDAAAGEQAAAAASDARKAQIRTVDRSERIRTYNYPQNRISDHRIGFTAYNLDLVVAGDLDGMLDALTEADRAARIAGQDLERH